MQRKRLLVITNSYPDKDDKHIGGIFVKEQVRHIAPHFEEVHVVFPSTFGLGHKPKEEFKDYTDGNVHVHFLPYVNVPLFLKVFRGGFTYLMARAIDRLVRKEGIKFDIIHAHFTWPSGAAAVRLKARYKVPLVVTEHTSLTLNRAVQRRDPEFLNTWASCDAVIRNRRDDIGLFESVGVPPEKVHHIPNGFDSHKFRPMDRLRSRHTLGLPMDGIVLVSVGGLEAVKGHGYLIEAVAEVVRTREGARCYIIGEGPLRDELMRHVRHRGLEQNVSLVGERPHGDLPTWLNASDMVVHSSLSESGPMVMLEALGCGRPFVGTRVGSVPEVIASDDYGLVSEPGDPSALARNILSALGRSWDSGKIVEHSRKYAAEWVSRELTDLYDRFLMRD